MSKWLVILGEGDWLPERGVRLSPGKHEVSDARALQARNSGIRRFIILDEEPEIVDYDPQAGGPLTPDHIRRGSASGVALKPEEITREDLLPVDDTPPSNYHCLHCDFSARTQAALERHVEFNHTTT
jgi:hypothetical protein